MHKFSACPAPGVGLVCRPVVGEDSFDDDATLGEPGDGALKYADGAQRLLIGADFGVGHAGVIVDDVVYERYSDPGSAFVAVFPGAEGGLAGIVFTLFRHRVSTACTVEAAMPSWPAT